MGYLHTNIYFALLQVVLLDPHESGQNSHIYFFIKSSLFYSIIFNNDVEYNPILLWLQTFVSKYRDEGWYTNVSV